jgi:hypothetical protein
MWSTGPLIWILLLFYMVWFWDFIHLMCCAFATEKNPKKHHCIVYASYLFYSWKYLLAVHWWSSLPLLKDLDLFHQSANWSPLPGSTGIHPTHRFSSADNCLWNVKKKKKTHGLYICVYCKNDIFLEICYQEVG